MSRRWTSEQEDAINKSGTNIIVSAGAGSGKTSVLTERIISKLRNGIDITSLLVLTFTKAASHEMKDRIRKSLKSDATLTKQLALIDASYITTFDSFALSIVKKYHYLINVSPNINICDSNVLNMEKNIIINNIFDGLYRSKDPNFLKLIGDFCLKDDQQVIKTLLEINKKLDMKYNKKEYLKDYLDNAFNEDKIKNNVNDFIMLIKNNINEIVVLLDKIRKIDNTDLYDKLELSLKALINSKTYDEYIANYNVELPRANKNTDEQVKTYKTNINHIIKEIRKICVWDSEQDIIDSIYKTKDYVKAIINIINNYDDKLNKYKELNDLYEYSDIASLAIKIVSENDEIRNELVNNFQEILVDEYQDTNDLQEAFISLISNNNVYMVGDIKQSIYRFRNANPDIFKAKYELYKNNHNGLKIDLNKNFRSRSEVINNINLIFNMIMDNNIGGANYKDEHQLAFGSDLFNDIIKQDHNLQILNYQFNKDLGFKKEEIEIFLIAQDIKEKIDSKYQVVDSKTEKLRDVEYKDFTILLDRGKTFDLYKKIFTYLKIPISIYKDESIASSSDILVIKSLLKLVWFLHEDIYDVEFKHAFMSVGRSFICAYDDDFLFNCIKNNNYKQTDLYQKALKISEQIDNISIYELLEVLIKEFNIIELSIKIGNVNDFINRIDYLLKTSITLASLGYNVSKFIDYLEENLNEKTDIKIPYIIEDNNACHIMTIHMAKGLEYSICYYASLSAKFNDNELKGLFYFDNTYGLIMPYFEEGISTTIYKDLFKNKYFKEEIEEKIRLFYVALTRCKEKMIVVADLNSDNLCDEVEGVVDNAIRLKYKSFNDMLLSIKDYLLPFISNIEINKHTVNLNYKNDYINNYQGLIPSSNERIVIDEINMEPIFIKNKTYAKANNELIDNATIEKMNIGSRVHQYLELLDLKNPDYKNIDSFYVNKINSFLKQDLLSNIKNAKIYKEYEFIYEDNNEQAHGIIDLLLEYDEHIKIIDYKYKNIDNPEYIKQLLGYEKYIESISNKRVEVYLYSIIDEVYKKIN